MRRSARDVGKAGWDADTGFGILDVPAALRASRRPPTRRSRTRTSTSCGRTGSRAPARRRSPRSTGRARRSAASLERREDPEDVYRVYLPAKGKVVVTVRPNANVDLELWGKQTRPSSSAARRAKRDLLGVSAHAGARFERVTLKGRGAGQFVYADVFLPKNGVQASYTLSVAPAAR